MAHLRRNLIGQRLLLRLRLRLGLALHSLTTFVCCALFTLPSLIRGATFMAIFADILTFMHSGRHQSRRVITCATCVLPIAQAAVELRLQLLSQTQLRECK